MESVIRKPLAVVGRTFNECLLLFPVSPRFSVFFRATWACPGSLNRTPWTERYTLVLMLRFVQWFLASRVFRQECCVLPLSSPGPDPSSGLVARRERFLSLCAYLGAWSTWAQADPPTMVSEDVTRSDPGLLSLPFAAQLLQGVLRVLSVVEGILSEPRSPHRFSSTFHELSGLGPAHPP